MARWQDHDHNSHVVQFYEDDLSLPDALSRFIGTALGAGDAAVVIATKTHREGLAQWLEERGLDMARAVKRGRYVSIDAADTQSKIAWNGSPDAGRFADIIGGTIARAKAAAEDQNPSVVIFGEMVALLWAEGKSEATSLAECDDLARQCVREIRTLSYLLHPPLLTEAGLVPALQWLINGFSERSGIQATLEHPVRALRVLRSPVTATSRCLRNKAQLQADSSPRSEETRPGGIEESAGNQSGHKSLQKGS